jgi:phospholipid/cholesterol/gamma-HCH transport system substrate-binding protein
MRRIVVIIALLVSGVAGLAASAGADDTHTYRIEMYNAFGLVEGSDVRIAGVNAGTVKSLDINGAKRAVATVELSGDVSTLGRDTQCSTEPQSLIAEYFITCDPAGPALPDDGLVPASQVSQTVQNDLVLNTLREPYRERLRLLINEFGTALAGDPHRLNEAIRLGAPALTQLHQVTSLLASQNRIIRNLNVNADRVIGKLAERREDVVRFVQEARDTAEAAVARRDDLSRDFEILDDFLAELRPTLAQLGTTARQSTPLLTDLRGAAPGLNRLAKDLPGFSGATRVALDSLGEASDVGSRALRRGRDEIRLLAQSGRKAPVTSEILADLVRDLDDPRRAVEIDDRVPRDTGRTDPQAGQPDTKGYTGLEGLLNYVYYQAGSLNQFDRIGHMLHISLYDVFSGPCGDFSSGRDPATGKRGVPAEGGGTTTNILRADKCVGWLGPNQPGINENIGLPPYDPSVCPNGTSPAAALALCDPGAAARPRARSGPAGGHGSTGASGSSGAYGSAAAPGGTGSAGGPGSAGAPAPAGGDGGGQARGAGALPGQGGQPPWALSEQTLQDLSDQAPRGLDELPHSVQDEVAGHAGAAASGGQVGPDGAPSAVDPGVPAPGGGSAAEDLLDFLFGS